MAPNDWPSRTESANNLPEISSCLHQLDSATRKFSAGEIVCPLKLCYQQRRSLISSHAPCRSRLRLCGLGKTFSLEKQQNGKAIPNKFTFHVLLVREQTEKLFSHHSFLSNFKALSWFSSASRRKREPENKLTFQQWTFSPWSSFDVDTWTFGCDIQHEEAYANHERRGKIGHINPSSGGSGSHRWKTEASKLRPRNYWIPDLAHKNTRTDPSCM